MGDALRLDGGLHGADIVDAFVEERGGFVALGFGCF